MKTIIMEQTFPLMFKTNEELNAFIVKDNYAVRKSKLGYTYLVKID